ncbi:MAG: transketolase C-terminal domain-containing protein [Thermoplasmata archaeon]
MRNAFVEVLSKQMSRDKNTILLSADLGWGSFDHIREKYSNQFFNVGLAEQAMIGISAGMAKMGKNVFAYSIIPFILYRAFEQVRNDVCYPDLPVRLVGTGAGLAYGEAGATHHPFEDLRISGALPNLVVLSPSDPEEVRVLFQKMQRIKHPTYMRLTRSGDPIIHNKQSSIRIGKALKLSEGDDILILSIGGVTKIALDAATTLNEKRDVAELLEIHTFKPFDDYAVIKAAEGKKLVVTVEDSTGALEERVAKVLINANRPPRLLSFKLPDQFTHIVGKSNYLLEHYGISAKNIIEQIKKVKK